MNRKAIFTAFVCALALAGATAQAQQVRQGRQTFSQRTSYFKKDRLKASYDRAAAPDYWPEPEGLAEGQKVMHLEMDFEGEYRKAVVIYPESAALKGGRRQGKHPVVFAFHGRCGLISTAMSSLSIHMHMPEAIVVYPQGLWLETPGTARLAWGSGWKEPTPDDEGYDLRFFDAMLDTLHAGFRVDDSRVYALGHSNGGRMVYSLWSLRGDRLAAVCISCSPSAPYSYIGQLRGPKPAFFILATEDQLIDFDVYMDHVRHVVATQTDGVGIPFSKGKTLYRSAEGNDVFVDIIKAPHSFDKAGLPQIVEFFRSHSLVQPDGRREKQK